MSEQASSGNVEHLSQSADYISEVETETERRKRRIQNICVWFINNFHIYAGRHLDAREIRKKIRIALDLEPDDIFGDNKANGDAMGKSGLNLVYIRDNGDRMILINQANLQKCKDWLAANVGSETREQREQRARDIGDLSLKSPRYILHYFFKTAIFYEFPDGMAREQFVERLANEFRQRRISAADAALTMVQYGDTIVKQISDRVRPGLSEIFSRINSAKELAEEGDYKAAFLAIYPNLKDESEKSDHYLT